MEKRVHLNAEQLVRLYDLRKMGDNYAKIEHIFRQEGVMTSATVLCNIVRKLNKYMTGTFTGKIKQRRYVEAAAIINARTQKPEKPAPKDEPFYHPDHVPAPAAVTPPEPVRIVPEKTNGQVKGFDEYDLLRGSLNRFLQEVEGFVVAKVGKVKAENDILKSENEEMRKAMEELKIYNWTGSLKKKLG